MMHLLRLRPAITSALLVMLCSKSQKHNCILPRSPQQRFAKKEYTVRLLICSATKRLHKTAIQYFFCKHKEAILTYSDVNVSLYDVNSDFHMGTQTAIIFPRAHCLPEGFPFLEPSLMVYFMDVWCCLNSITCCNTFNLYRSPGQSNVIQYKNCIKCLPGWVLVKH